MRQKKDIEQLLREAGVVNAKADAEILVNIGDVIVNVPTKTGIITSDDAITYDKYTESKEKLREDAQIALRAVKRRYGFPLDSGKDS